MTNTADLLELIDTTVTLEWESTRTIGTLVALGERTATLTALRAPPANAQVFMRIENEDPSQNMALDGICLSVVDSDWGEQQVEVALVRVGTTASAAALREFIERHGIERGGTVSVGRNRDNPELKRYVYALPEKVVLAPSAVAAVSAATAPGQAAAPSAPAAAVAAPSSKWTAEVPMTTPALTDWASSTAPAAGPVYFAPSASAAAPAGIGPSTTPTTPAPQDDLAAAWQEALASMDPQERQPTAPMPAAAPMAGEPAARLPGARPSGSVSAENTSSYGRAPSKPSAPTAVTEHDESEQILVNIVEAGSQASPVFRVQKDVKPASRPSTPGASFRADSAHLHAHPEEKPAHAADLFGTELSVRLDLAVQFEAGPKKRKYDGKLLRLGESKLRVATQVLPACYERIAVYVPGKAGMKDALALHCEVTRIHRGETDGIASFDARLTTGGNTASTMARLRQLLQEQGGGAAP